MIYLLLIIAAQIFILSRLVFFPYPELFIYPYLTNHGLIPYRDILDQHFPGLMFLPVNFDNLGMNSPGQARFVQFLLVAVIQVLIFFIARKVFKSEKMALLANLIFLLWQPFFEGWVLWIDSFLPVFLLPAFYFSYEAWHKGKSKNLFLAGLFLGMGIVFKQVVIPLTGLTFLLLYLKRRNIKEMLWFILGVVPLPLLMLWNIISKGIFSDFWYWTVTFNLTTFAQFGRRAGSFSEIVRVAAVYGFSALAIFEKKFRTLFLLISVFIFGALFSANARFDFVHFQPSLPFICILTVIALEFAWKKVKLLIPIYLIGVSVFLFTFYKGNIGTKVFFFENQDLRITQKISQTVKPGEKVFLFGLPPHYYQMTKTIPAGNIMVFQFPWFMMIAEDRVLAGLEKDQPSLVVADRTVTSDGQKITDFAGRINGYLIKNYQTYDKIGNTEFLRLKK